MEASPVSPPFGVIGATEGRAVYKCDVGVARVCVSELVNKLGEHRGGDHGRSCSFFVVKVIQTDRQMGMNGTQKR